MANDGRNCEECGLPIEGEAVPVKHRALEADLASPVDRELIGDVVFYVHPEHFDLTKWVRADDRQSSA
jgi:hypothetical protein